MDLDQYKRYTMSKINALARENNVANTWQLFEWAGCLASNTIPWHLVPPTIKEAKNIPIVDHGIDGISSDFTRAVQVKYRNNTSVTFREISTFYTSAREFTNSDELVLLHSETAKIAKSVTALTKISKHVLSQETFEQILNSCLTYVVPPVPPKVLQYRPYQLQCLEVCQKRWNEPATKIEMAYGTGKTLVFRGLVDMTAGMNEPSVIMVPSLHLLEQIGTYLPTATKIGTGYNTVTPNTVYICVYNSVARLEGLTFGTVIIDEGHHLENVPEQEEPTYRGLVLQIPAKRKFFFSATLNGEDIDFSYGLNTAIIEKYLTDYDIIIPVVSNTDHIPQAMVKLLNTRLDLRWVLAYCNSRESANDFNTLLNERGIKSAYFDGTTPMSQRQEYIKQFEAGIYRVLVTVHVLNEGVDIPCVDTTMFVEPRRSHINVGQCIGRALRLHPEKAIAHVILPTTREEKELETFLQLMAEDDDRIKESIRNRRYGRVNLVDLRDDKDDDNLEEFYVSIYDRFGQCLVNIFDERIELLKAFVAKENRLPSTREKYNDFLIGSWIVNQRTHHRKGQLSHDEISKLEAIPHWTWGIHRLPWDQHYDLLVEFVTIHGRLPKSGDIHRDANLGTWMYGQYRSHNCGKLNDVRIARLNLIPGWKWRKPKIIQKSWKEWYDLLIKFIESYQRPPKHNESIDGFNLGNWLSIQFTRYNNGTLLPERIAMLELIPGLAWRIPRIDPWEKWYDSLQEFVTLYQRFPRNREAYKEFNLGDWVQTQRNNYKAGKLTQDQILKLELLPNWKWRMYTIPNWDDVYQLLMKFIDAHGKFPVFKEEYENVKIGMWINRQRQEYRTKSIVQDRSTKLEALPGWHW